MSTRRHLTAAETAFVAARRLGRLATVNRDGSPQVNPVMVYWNAAAGCIDIGGHNMACSQKFRNAWLPGANAAVVIDDMRDDDPRTIRCLEIRGEVEAVLAPTDSAARVDGAIIRITPARVISWGM